MKFIRFCQKHITVIQIILFVSVFIVALVSKFSDDTTALMIDLLVFIGMEIFTLIVGYLDRIIVRLDEVGELVKIYDKHATPAEFPETIKAIKSAKHDVIIIGSSLSSYEGIKNVLKVLPPNVELKFYKINPDYMDKVGDAYNVLNYASAKRAHDLHDIFMKNAFEIIKRSKPDTELYMLDNILPITYLAIDTKTQSDSSVIYADHYLWGEDSALTLEAKPGCTLYNVYLNQLREIDKKATGRVVIN